MQSNLMFLFTEAPHYIGPLNSPPKLLSCPQQIIEAAALSFIRPYCTVYLFYSSLQDDTSMTLTDKRTGREQGSIQL